MLFRPRVKEDNEVNLKIMADGIELKQVQCVKFLGLYIDENLNWTQHVNHVLTKLSQNKFLLNTTKHILPVWSKRTLYYAQIYSHLSYGIFLWGPMLIASLKKRLFTVQKACVRIITNSTYNATTSPIFKELMLLKLDDIIELELCKFAYQLTHKLLPTPIENLFATNFGTNAYTTRHSNCPHIAKHTSSIFNKSFLCKSISLWTSLPQSIKNSTSLKSFGKSIIRQKISSY